MNTKPILFLLLFPLFSGCLGGTEEIQIPSLTVGTIVTYELAGVPLSPWGGVPSNVQKDGESILPALNEEFRISTSGPYCTLGHDGKRTCNAYALTYELMRNNEWMYIGENLVSKDAGLISVNLASLQGNKELFSDDDFEVSEVWFDSFRRGSVDAFGGLLFGGLTASGNLIQIPAIRYGLNANFESLALALEINEGLGEFTFPASPGMGEFHFQVDSQCPFPTKIQGHHSTGELAMIATRKTCERGVGMSLTVESLAPEYETPNPYLMQSDELLTSNEAAAFQPGIGSLGDLISVIETEFPASCESGSCNIAKINFEPEIVPNLTILQEEIGERLVDRWTICLYDNGWKNIQIDWSPERYEIEDAGTCPYIPKGELDEFYSINMAGLEKSLNSFSGGRLLTYELRLIPEPNAPDIIASIGFDSQGPGEENTISTFPLWWSMNVDGYIAQANWPERLKSSP
jgi:hypothetical protein